VSQRLALPSRSLALATLAVAALALLGVALLDSSTALAGKAADSCKAKSEKAGCPLPEGAVFSGAGSAGSIKVTFDRYGGAYLEAKVVAGVTCDQSAGTVPPHIIGFSGFRKKTIKVGSTVNFPLSIAEGDGTAVGPVTFSSAKRAHAKLAVEDEGKYCRGSIELDLTRK
jgi:hypothetical protein